MTIARLLRHSPLASCSSFFFNDTATTEIYTLSLHDALPISRASCLRRVRERPARVETLILQEREHVAVPLVRAGLGDDVDRKSTRLNSSHDQISYAVFCLKKKINLHLIIPPRASSSK